MRTRDRHQALVPNKCVEPALRALLVHKVEELALRDRISVQCDPIRKIEALGLVLADTRDEQRRAPKLPGEGLDLRLERDDLGVDDAARSARLDRGLCVAADRK